MNFSHLFPGEKAERFFFFLDKLMFWWSAAKGGYYSRLGLSDRGWIIMSKSPPWEDHVLSARWKPFSLLLNIDHLTDKVVHDLWDRFLWLFPWEAAAVFSAMLFDYFPICLHKVWFLSGSCNSSRILFFPATVGWEWGVQDGHDPKPSHRISAARSVQKGMTCVFQQRLGTLLTEEIVAVKNLENRLWNSLLNGLTLRLLGRKATCMQMSCWLFAKTSGLTHTPLCLGFGRDKY